ncbi:hypothetical protein [Nitratifractor salsuginis]|uniref:Uncharacterized protein n=1 Tax=Nitratifractor salsuginis (strain DSM 16511 / JCM 12458 / E9I37-1) TaxID=749222 RepID=E6X1S3_NITSE|nr:hypothetical protein [Nitratifractor salsuginis]ADV47064.1 hypothetical protein Nitsa_1819 [Nitratifractor salsuginis DSM 16511]
MFDKAIDRQIEALKTELREIRAKRAGETTATEKGRLIDPYFLTRGDTKMSRPISVIEAGAII